MNIDLGKAIFDALFNDDGNLLSQEDQITSYNETQSQIAEDEATAAGIVRATLIIDRLNGDNKQIIAHKVIADDEV